MRFFFHFNKPASRSAGKPIISVHYQKKCTLVENVVCNVKTRGKIRKTQPVFVITGTAQTIEVIDNIAHIN